MLRARAIRDALACAGAAVAAAVAILPVQAQTRPRLEISDPARSCPAIAGSFVALLDADRGMLLLSGEEFLGGERLAATAGDTVRLSSAATGSWSLAHASVAPGPLSLWGRTYPFTGDRVTGCVAFDRDRFSSEGDLVTYLRWVVDGVYLALPAEERQRWPALRIAGREIAVRVTGLGFQPLPLAGKEGAAIAFRLPGVDRTFLLTPFVIDEASSRVAVMLASTAEAFWVGSDKKPLGWVVASQAQPGTLADPPLTIAVVSVSATEGRR